MGHKISKEQIDPGVKDHIMSFVGDVNELETEANTDIISAVNSLIVDRVDNAENMGKLANAIGEPVTANHSIDEVVQGLGEMLSTFKTNMMNSGVTVESSDKFKQLIDKIKGLTEGEGNKGIQYTEITQSFSVYKASGVSEMGNSVSLTKDILFDIDFEPTIIILDLPQLKGAGAGLKSDGRILLSLDAPKYTFSNTSYKMSVTLTELTSTGAILNFWGMALGTSAQQSEVICSGDIKIYAIGVGEEDTTLRDSLASILQEEGVSVTEEDDMASLITKVEGEITEKNNEINSRVVPAGTATADDVLTGKTFINSTGELLTGTIPNRGGARTVTPGTDNTVLESGYYGGNITIAGSSNLKAENIAAGVNIFGIYGNATVIPSSMVTEEYTISNKVCSGYVNGDTWSQIGSLTIPAGTYYIKIVSERSDARFGVYESGAISPVVSVHGSGTSVGKVTLSSETIFYCNGRSYGDEIYAGATFSVYRKKVSGYI